MLFYCTIFKYNAYISTCFFFSRDDCNRTRNSTFGTYKPAVPKQSTATTISNLSQTIQPHVMRKQVIGEDGSSLYTSAPSSDYDRLATTDSENLFPDVLGGKFSDSASFANNNLTKSVVGGSVDNINKSTLYGTLPKKKTWKTGRYQSDSQSPLLPSSRYGSSGGESYSSNSSRRLSDDSFKYPLLNNNVRANQRSNSYLNLVTTTNSRTNPAPTNKNLDSTPLLDVSGLESRLEQNRENLLSPTNTSMANSYDYHAAQLERFLEEYRTLQKELNKMKETCESIRQCEDKTLTNSRFLDPLLHNNVITPTSSSEEGNPKSILKKSPASLTPSPAGSGVLDASSPLSSSYWSSRNSQKRYEGVYYKS